MPLERICICKAYADGEYMHMFDLCRCQAYGYATPIYSSLFFPPRSDFWLFRIFFKTSGAQRRQNTTYATLSAAVSSIYRVFSLPHDRPLTTGKHRVAYCLIKYFAENLQILEIRITRKQVFSNSLKLLYNA